MTLKCLYSSSQAILKPSQSVRGHFVTLIEVVMHLISCNPGHKGRQVLRKGRGFVCEKIVSWVPCVI